MTGLGTPTTCSPMTSVGRMNPLEVVARTLWRPRERLVPSHWAESAPRRAPESFRLKPRVDLPWKGLHQTSVYAIKGSPSRAVNPTPLKTERDASCPRSAEAESLSFLKKLDKCGNFVKRQPGEQFCRNKTRKEIMELIKTQGLINR